jgi:hypothetical protein
MVLLKRILTIRKRLSLRRWWVQMRGTVGRSHHVIRRHHRIVHVLWYICSYRLLVLIGILLLLVGSWSMTHVVIREHVPGVEHVVCMDSWMSSFPENSDVARVSTRVRGAA